MKQVETMSSIEQVDDVEETKVEEHVEDEETDEEEGESVEEDVGELVVEDLESALQDWGGEATVAERLVALRCMEEAKIASRESIGGGDEFVDEDVAPFRYFNEKTKDRDAVRVPGVESHTARALKEYREKQLEDEREKLSEVEHPCAIVCGECWSLARDCCELCCDGSLRTCFEDGNDRRSVPGCVKWFWFMVGMCLLVACLTVIVLAICSSFGVI